MFHQRLRDRLLVERFKIDMCYIIFRHIKCFYSTGNFLFSFNAFSISNSAFLLME
jgi:hypothetical protein